MGQRSCVRMIQGPEINRYIPKHFRIGWWSLLVFLTLGLALETMHGFKIGWYLDVSNESRRLMWTLAHAHGTLFSLIHLGFAATLNSAFVKSGERYRTPSAFLTAAIVLLPGGFFINGGDPGIGVMLVPVGAVCLLLAVFMTVCGLSNERIDGH